VTILSCISSSSPLFSSSRTNKQSSTNGLDEGMIDKSCAILNEISIKASLSLTNALLNMSLVLSHQSLYQSQSTSLPNTNTNTKTKRRRFKNDDEDQEEARVREGVVG